MKIVPLAPEYIKASRVRGKYEIVLLARGALKPLRSEYTTAADAENVLGTRGTLAP